MSKKIRMSNMRRYQELDLAKGLGIFFMVLIHFSMVLWADNKSMEIQYRIVNALGSFPAAPVFMFALGAGIVFSRRSSPGKQWRRGLRLLACGYLVINLLVYGMPGLLVNWWHGTLNEKAIAQFVQDLITVDILQFSGLAMILFALITKLKVPDWCTLAGAAVMSIAGAWLKEHVSIQGVLATGGADLIWGAGDMSFFPLLTWFIFPVSGFLFAKWGMTRCENKNRFYTWSLIAGTLVYGLLSLMAVKMDVGFGNFGEYSNPYEYYHMPLLGGLAVVGFVIAWLSICYFATKILPDGIMRIICRWSKHITGIYILHFAFLHYGNMFRPQGLAFPFPVILLLSAGVLVISDCITGAWERMQKRV